MMSQNAPMHLGLVGLGRIAEKHLKALTQLKGQYVIQALCDTNPSRLSEAQAFLHTPGFAPAETYTEFGAFLEKSALDCVMLATPSALHPLQGAAMAERKVDVLTEKPMATRLEEGRNLVATCKKNRVQLFVVHQMRFQPILVHLKRALEAGCFGKIYSVAVRIFWTRPQNYYDEAPWRGTRDWDGGVLLNQTSHYADLLRWLFGPVRSVQAYTGTLGRNIEVEDSAAVSFDFHSGALGTFHASVLTYPENLEAAMTIIGERGTVELAGRALNSIRHWCLPEAPLSKEALADLNTRNNARLPYLHTDFYRHVFAHLRLGRRGALGGGQDGLETLRFIDACYRSAQEERRVALDS